MHYKIGFDWPELGLHKHEDPHELRGNERQEFKFVTQIKKIRVIRSKKMILIT